MTLKTEAERLASPVAALSFICLQNSLFAEAPNVASPHLYANHSYTNKAGKRISLMFAAAKSHPPLFMLLSTPEDIIPALISPRRSSPL